MIAIAILLISVSPVLADTYENYDPNAIVSCGEKLMDNIPSLFPKIISIAYKVIQVAVPVVLVIVGSLDLFKGISAQKEDDIKKGQQIFIKRLIAAAIIFFVFAIVKIVISFAADGTGSKIIDCAQCFIENKCEAPELPDLPSETEKIDIDTIMYSIRNTLDDPDNPEYVSNVRQGLISIIGENFSGDNNSLIEEIEKRLQNGDNELRKKLILYLYYEL